jgi:DnaJ-domain-containing protein 1
VSIPRRLGRLARGFVLNLSEDERFRETLRTSQESRENLRGAFEAAWRGAAEEWRTAEQQRVEEEAREEPRDGRRRSAASFIPRRFPPEVISAYHRLGLGLGAPLEEVRKKRREMVKLYHPDRFTDPAQYARAERRTAEINAAHDTIARHLLRNKTG